MDDHPFFQSILPSISSSSHSKLKSSLPLNLLCSIQVRPPSSSDDLYLSFCAKRVKGYIKSVVLADKIYIYIYIKLRQLQERQKRQLNRILYMLLTAHISWGCCLYRKKRYKKTARRVAEAHKVVIDWGPY